MELVLYDRREAIFYVYLGEKRLVTNLQSCCLKL